MFEKSEHVAPIESFFLKQKDDPVPAFDWLEKYPQGRVEVLPPGVMPVAGHQFSPRELATVLYSLRVVQRILETNESSDAVHRVRDFYRAGESIKFGGVEILSGEDVDELCERLNTAD